MTKKGRFDLRLNFEETPIIKSKVESITELEDIVKALKKKFQ